MLVLKICQGVLQPAGRISVQQKSQGDLHSPGTQGWGVGLRVKFHFGSAGCFFGAAELTGC